MPNAVYALVAQALTNRLAPFAPGPILQAALRDEGLSSETVTAAQMQAALAGPLLERLSALVGPRLARAELANVADRLAREHPRFPTLFTDLGSFTDWEPRVTDWNGGSDFGSGGATGGEGDAGSTVLAAPTLAAEATPREGGGALPTQAGQAAHWEGDAFASDDFEFDDPDYAAPAPRRSYALSEVPDQEALIRDLGRMPGVQGVLISRGHETVRARTLRDSAPLSRVLAATTLLLRGRSLRLLSADLGGQTVCMRPMGEHSVTVIAGEQANIGRLLTELQQLEAR